MKVTNWVRFALITVAAFIIAIAIINAKAIWDALKSFPLDWIISFLLGSVAMGIANIRPRSDESDGPDE